MNPTIVADALRLATEVAHTVAPALAPGVALNVGEAQRGPFELDLGHAVVASLGGACNGELALFVDDEFGQSLSGSGLDLAAALAPALEQAAAALGSALLGRPMEAESRMAQSRVNALGDCAVVALDDGVAIRAAVAVGLEAGTVAAPAPVAVAPVSSHERLDLLRHVEMAATVELGRARMTINELLSLRDGAIIELDRAAGEAADLFVNGRLMARGEIVVVDENYALRVTQIVTDEPGR